MNLKDQLNQEKLPKHVAIIMDGNGRWAKQHGKPRIFGHRNGVTAVRETTEVAAELGIQFLTLYAFSTENWNRPKIEVNALMSLLVETMRKEISTLMDNNIRLKAIGDIDKLPRKTHRALLEGMETTASNDHMTLILALNYSSRWEIHEAVRKISRAIEKGELDSSDINPELFQNSLTTAGIPDPEFMIRTSGETRISNFLLYQLAYTELYFTKTLWPDFRKEHFYQALLDFQNRERRFGKTSEQITSTHP